MEELKENRELMKKGDGDSSSGSDDAPSEDNLRPDEIVKVLPVVDKKIKAELARQKKNEEKKLKDSKSKKNIIQKPEKPGQKQEETKEVPKIAPRKTIVAPSKDDPKPDHINNKKEEEKKKPKPVMVDACTQTDRSDYAIIKARYQARQ